MSYPVPAEIRGNGYVARPGSGDERVLLCLGCGELPPHDGCSALCAACASPNGSCHCAACKLVNPYLHRDRIEAAVARVPR